MKTVRIIAAEDMACSGCGGTVTVEEWQANTSRRLWHFADETLEIAEHSCKSTISRSVSQSF